MTRGLPARAAGVRDRPAGARATGGRALDETDLEIVRAAAELSRFGVAGRNLRVFRTSADREAALLEQLLGARCAHAARRAAGRRSRTSRAWPRVCGHLKHLLLVRDLRRLKSRPSESDSADILRFASGVGGRRALREAGVSGATATASLARAVSRSADSGRAGGRLVLPDPHSTSRAGGHGRCGSRTCAVGGASDAVDDGAAHRARAPACAPTTAAPASTAERRYAWEQEVAGTPFERILRSSKLEIGLDGEPAGRGSR